MREALPIHDKDNLAIGDVAELTGLAAGTIRAWEQRYGFPTPARSETGFRRYRSEDVQALRRVVAYRERGLSMATAIERSRDDSRDDDRLSLYATVVDAHPQARPQVLRKGSLISLSRAIEHEIIAHGARPVVFGAFQHERFYRAVEPLYRRLASMSDVATVFADFPVVAHPEGGPVEIPIRKDEPLGNEWVVIVDAPGYAACLLAWEQPQLGSPDAEPVFEAVWTLDPYATRRAATVAARLVAQQDPEYGAHCEEVLRDRPLALESPAPALTALCNRVVAYLEADGAAVGSG